MPFTKAITGRKISTETLITTEKKIKQDSRLCKDCKFYVPSKKYCPLVGKIENPSAYFCSWYKPKN